MVLHPNIEVRASGISGHGLYAKAPISKGEALWRSDPDEKERYWFTTDQIKTWSKEEQDSFMNGAYQVAPNTYSGVRFGVESDKGEYMNHCCEPNCVFENDDLCVAWRDIAVDEEITYDYATSETPESSHMPMTCGCGKATCRGTITGRDCLLPELRSKYAGYFTSLVLEFQAAEDAKAAAAGAAGGAGVVAPSTTA